MSQKETLIAKVVQDIKNKTAANSISPTILGEVIVAVVEAALTPSFLPGEATEIYTLDGKPVFRKLLFEANGNLLSDLDLSLPPNSALLDLTSIKETVKTATVGIRSEARDTQSSGTNTVVFKGAGNEFKLGGVDVTGADLIFTIRNTNTGQDTIFNATYTAGADVNVTLPSDSGTYRIERIRAQNITGATWGQSVAIAITIVVNGTPFSLNLNTDNTFPSNDDIVFEYGNLRQYQSTAVSTWSIALIFQTFNLIYSSLQMTGGVSLAGTVPFTIKFPDNTTEEITANFQGGEVTFQVQKNISSFGTDGDNFNLEFIAPATPVVLTDPQSNPVSCLFISKTVQVSLQNQYTYFIDSATDQLLERSLNFVQEVEQNLQNDPFARNVFITLLYIDLTEPAP